MTEGARINPRWVGWCRANKLDPQTFVGRKDTLVGGQPWQKSLLQWGNERLAEWRKAHDVLPGQRLTLEQDRAFEAWLIERFC